MLIIPNTGCVAGENVLLHASATAWKHIPQFERIDYTKNNTISLLSDVNQQKLFIKFFQNLGEVSLVKYIVLHEKCTRLQKRMSCIFFILVYYYIMYIIIELPLSPSTQHTVLC